MRETEASPLPRRQFLASASLGTSALLASTPTSAQNVANPNVEGTAHWVVKTVGGEQVRLFAWRKQSKSTWQDGKARGTLVFVHGSSVSSTPVYDLQVPGRDDASLMDWFARKGYDTWCFDCEGYGRSDKQRPVNADVACGADDLAAVTDYILRQNGGQKLMLYGSSSGALRVALFAQRHPERIQRIALDAMVWTGDNSPTLAERKKRLPAYLASNRRPIDRNMIRSIFTRDHPGTSDLTVVEAFADAVLALDDSMPTGTYIDMSSKLPVCDPVQIRVPTLILRGEYDGIASFQDLTAFFEKLGHPDKQFVVMQGIAHSSTRSKNYALVYHQLASYFAQPEPVYKGA